MGDLFDAAGLGDDVRAPLAERVRPKRLEEVVGQDHLLGPGKPLRRMAETKRVSSFVLWGPPGVGKTTIARLLAAESDLAFEQISAIFSGVGELRDVFKRAEGRKQTGKGTLLFVDEIHRFNKSQQDAFLPQVESGNVILIGATTENPSFELNAALLSRAQVFTLNRLSHEAVKEVVLNAAEVCNFEIPLTEEGLELLIRMADGDGRYALNLVEQVIDAQFDKKIGSEELSGFIQHRALTGDKSGDAHYNLASVLQKSIRASDVDAALYWAARMIEGGEDPKFIFRRLIVIASEDVGNADASALPLAIAARDAFEMLGRPEGDIPLGQLVAYLASAPKSNRAHMAFKRAKALAREAGSLAPPMHALNAPTKLMKNQGYSEGYVYDHDTKDSFSGLNYFPAELERRTLYEPNGEGGETEIRSRMDNWRRLREKLNRGSQERNT